MSDIIPSPELAGVRDPNIGADGLPINWRMQERAGILGTILFLEQVARWDTSEEFRKGAAHQAKFLRVLMGRRANSDRNDLDGALREALEQLLAPPPKQLQAPVRQLPHNPDEVIDT